MEQIEVGMSYDQVRDILKEGSPTGGGWGPTSDGRYMMTQGFDLGDHWQVTVFFWTGPRPPTPMSGTVAYDLDLERKGR